MLVITTYAKNYASTNCQSLDSADPKLPLCPPPQQKSDHTRHEPGTVVTRLLNWTTGHRAIPVQGCFNIDRITAVISMLTVRQLEPGHLEENCPITTISENKSFSSYFFFGERTNKIQNTIMQPLKTLKSFQLT